MGRVVICAPSFWWTKDIRNDKESQYSYLLEGLSTRSSGQFIQLASNIAASVSESAEKLQTEQDPCVSSVLIKALTKEEEPNICSDAHFLNPFLKFQSAACCKKKD